MRIDRTRPWKLKMELLGLGERWAFVHGRLSLSYTDARTRKPVIRQRREFIAVYQRIESNYRFVVDASGELKLVEDDQVAWCHRASIGDPFTLEIKDGWWHVLYRPRPDLPHRDWLGPLIEKWRREDDPLDQAGMDAFRHPWTMGPVAWSRIREFRGLILPHADLGLEEEELLGGPFARMRGTTFQDGADETLRGVVVLVGQGLRLIDEPGVGLVLRADRLVGVTEDDGTGRFSIWLRPGSYDVLWFVPGHLACFEPNAAFQPGKTYGYEPRLKPWPKGNLTFMVEASSYGYGPL